MAIVVRSARESAARTREQLRDRVAREDRLLEHSLSALTHVIEGEEATGGEGGADDPLVEACRLIGKRLGLVMKAPPAHASTGDPVVDVARASKARVRRVALRGDWWRRDAGPLLAFTAEGDRPVALVPEGARYRIHDPGARTSSLVGPEVAASLRPSAFMFYPWLGDRAATVLGLWWIGARGLGRDQRLIVWTSLLASLAALAPPIISKVLLDEVIPSAGRS